LRNAQMHNGGNVDTKAEAAYLKFAALQKKKIWG
jgi:hypothetical protein